MIETLEHPACRNCCRDVRVDGTPCRRKTAWASGVLAVGDRQRAKTLPELRRDAVAERFRAGAPEAVHRP